MPDLPRILAALKVMMAGSPFSMALWLWGRPAVVAEALHASGVNAEDLTGLAYELLPEVEWLDCAPWRRALVNSTRSPLSAYGFGLVQPPWCRRSRSISSTSARFLACLMRSAEKPDRPKNKSLVADV